MSDEYTDPCLEPLSDLDVERDSWLEYLEETELAVSDRAIRLGGMPGQLRPDWKPRLRQRATRSQWQEWHRQLQAMRCALCGDPATSLHHVVRKSQGGDDRADNLMALCGTGTTGCHGQVEARRPETLAAVRAALTAQQHAYVLERKGAGWLDRAYPVREAA